MLPIDKAFDRGGHWSVAALQRLAAGPVLPARARVPRGRVPPAITASVAGARPLGRVRHARRPLRNRAAVGREPGPGRSPPRGGRRTSRRSTRRSTRRACSVATGVPRHYRFRHPIRAHGGLRRHSRRAGGSRRMPAWPTRCGPGPAEDPRAPSGALREGGWRGGDQRCSPRPPRGRRRRPRRAGMRPRNGSSAIAAARCSVPLPNALRHHRAARKSAAGAARLRSRWCPATTRLIAPSPSARAGACSAATLPPARLSTLLPEHGVALPRRRDLRGRLRGPGSREAKRAVAAEPENATAWSLLALATARSVSSPPPTRRCTRAAALVDATPDEELVDSAYYLGFAEYMCERDVDAIRHFRRPAQGPLRLPMLVGLAHALERQGRLWPRRWRSPSVLSTSPATTSCSRGRARRRTSRP